MAFFACVVVFSEPSQSCLPEMRWFRVKNDSKIDPRVSTFLVTFRAIPTVSSYFRRFYVYYRFCPTKSRILTENTM